MRHAPTWRICVAALGLVSVACASRAPAARPAPESSQPPPPAAKPAKHWEPFEQALTWPTSTPDWFISEGHYAGTSEALVHVTPAAIAQYRNHSRGSTFAPGTMIVMLHRKRSNRTPGPVHVMVRGAQDWDYLLLHPDGTIQQEGKLPLCQRCHSEAVSDSVFGAAAPVSTAPASDAASASPE